MSSPMLSETTKDWFKCHSCAYGIKRQCTVEKLSGRLLYLARGTLHIDFVISDHGNDQHSATLLFQDEVLDLAVLRFWPRSSLRAVGTDATYYLAKSQDVARAHDAGDLMERTAAVTGRLARQKILGSTCGVDGQLCTLLVELGIRFGIRHGSGLQFKLPLSRDVMAAVIGVRPESLSRAMTRAKASGLIKISGRSQVAVPDWDALCARSPIADLLIAANQ